jgi:hypothetical protein
MFIRRTTRKYKDRVYTNYQLVQSVQTPKGPRQKLICSLGDLSPRPADRWRHLAHQVEDALQGQSGLLEEAQEAEVGPIVHQIGQRHAGRVGSAPCRGGGSSEGERLTVHADRVQVERPREAGPVHVGYQFWKRLGMDEILHALEFSERAIQLTCAMTLNRLIHPASEHAMPDWIRSTALEDLLDVDFKLLGDDPLYRNLDRLYPNRATIESALVQREQSLFNLQPTVFFYDLTSTYFEGQALAYAENLQEIRDRQLHYVIAARQPERDQWLDDFEDPQGFEEVHREPSPRNPFQKKSTVRVKLLQRDGERFVLCTSSERVAKDRAIREKQEARFLADLEKLQRRIDAGRLVREMAIGEALGRLKERYPRVARYHTLSYDAAGRRLVHEPNEAKKAKAELLDGGYLLRTDREDLTGPEAWLLYMTLTRAEAAFRAMKSPLAERPIFHQVERRVETHIFLCVLAYHLLVAIETTLLGHGLHTSWATVREALATHQVVTIVLPTDTSRVLRIRKGTVPEREHQELYRLLKIPEEIIRPQRTWSTLSNRQS